MGPEILPFAEEHLPSAARLLAERVKDRVCERLVPGKSVCVSVEHLGAHRAGERSNGQLGHAHWSLPSRQAAACQSSE